jgi:hypothetical protein
MPLYKTHHGLFLFYLLRINAEVFRIAYKAPSGLACFCHPQHYHHQHTHTHTHTHTRRHTFLIPQILQNESASAFTAMPFFEHLTSFESLLTCHLLNVTSQDALCKLQAVAPFNTIQFA